MRKLLYAGIILSFSFLLIAAGCQVTQQPPTTAPGLSQAEVISSTGQFTRTLLQLDASAIKWAKAKKVTGMVGVGVQTTGITAMATSDVHGWTRTTEESTTVAGTYKADYYYQEVKDFNGNLTDVLIYGIGSLDTGATGSAVRSSDGGGHATGSTSSLTMGKGVSNPPQRPTSSDPPNGVNPIHIQYTYENSNQLSTYSISGYVAFKIVDNQTHKQTLFVVTNLNITGSGKGDNFLPENGTFNVDVTTTTADNQSSTQTMSLKFEDKKILVKYDGLPELDIARILNWFLPATGVKITVNPPNSGPYSSWFPPLGQINGTATLWIYAVDPFIGPVTLLSFNNDTALTHLLISSNNPVTLTVTPKDTTSTKEYWYFAIVFDGDHPSPEIIQANDAGFAGEWLDGLFYPMGMGGDPHGAKVGDTLSFNTNFLFHP